VGVAGPEPVEKDSREILDPGLLRQRVSLTRYSVGPTLRGLVDRFWAVAWDLRAGVVHTQQVLTHLGGNLSVGHPTPATVVQRTRDGGLSSYMAAGISAERETGVEPATFSLASISSLALCDRDQRGHHSVSTYMLPATPFEGHFPGTQPVRDDPPLTEGQPQRNSTGLLAVVLTYLIHSAVARERRG